MTLIKYNNFSIVIDTLSRVVEISIDDLLLM